MLQKKSEREKLMIWYIKDTGSTVTFLFSVRCAGWISWEEVKKWTNRKGRKLQSTNETQAADTRGGTTKEKITQVFVVKQRTENPAMKQTRRAWKRPSILVGSLGQTVGSFTRWQKGKICAKVLSRLASRNVFATRSRWTQGTHALSFVTWRVFVYF